MKRFIFLALMAVASTMYAKADTATFTLIPASGNVSGNAGTVVGWGFTFDNTSSNWEVLTGSTFSGSPVYGVYNDYIASNFYVADPGQTISETWNQSTMSGVGEYDLYATDPPGTIIPGTIMVSYDSFSQDPNSSFDPESYVGSDSASQSAAVAVPESSSLSLLITALLLSLSYPLWRRRISLQVRNDA